MLLSTARFTGDFLGGNPAFATTVVGGFVATPQAPANLAINLSAGEIYQFVATDAQGYGSLGADSALIVQQGRGESQSVLLTTGALAVGQSQWGLVQVTFVQSDVIRDADPTGGLLYFFNASNPTQPLQGQGNSNTTLPTERRAGVLINVIYGTPAATGSEVPPSPTAGFVPLYLVDLVYGQTAIIAGNIKKAKPLAGTGVPSNYPYAPFLAGLLNAHHHGTTGEAPQIDLTSEVKNILPLANLPASVRQGATGLPTDYYCSPNGDDDTGNGTISLPWKTLKRVIKHLLSFLDIQNVKIKIHLADSGAAHYAGCHFEGNLPGQVVDPDVFTPNIQIIGNTTTPGNCIISGVNAHGFKVKGLHIWLSGMTINTTGTDPDGLPASACHCEAGRIDVDSTVVFGAVAGGHFEIHEGGICGTVGVEAAVNGSYQITGGGQFHIRTRYGGKFRQRATAVTITLTGTPVFSLGFVVTSNNGHCSIPSGTTTFSGGASAGTPRYLCTNAGGVDTGGGGATFLPGGTAGTATSPGYYS